MCLALLLLATLPEGRAFQTSGLTSFFGGAQLVRANLAKRPRGLLLRASAEREEIERLRAGEIKERLFQRGISHAGLFEKSELVDKLLAALADETNKPSNAEVDALKNDDASELVDQLCQLGGFRAPLSRMMAREGTLGENVRIDEKDYYAVRTKFPELSCESDFIIDSAASNSVVTPQWAQGKGAKATGVIATVAGGTSAGGGIQQLHLGALQIATTAGWQACGSLDAVALEVPVPSSVGGLLGLDFLSRCPATRTACVLACFRSCVLALPADPAAVMTATAGSMFTSASAALIRKPSSCPL